MVAILLQFAGIMVGMKKLAILLALLLLPAFALGQTGAYSGHTFVGGVPATTSGMNSSNYMDGIIPGASVTVYLTGTTTKATIYADGSNTPRSNPFFSNLAPGTNPGGFIFWAAQNQGLDIQAQGGMGNASCTTSPLCYSTATTLQVDVYPSAGSVTAGWTVTGSGASQVVTAPGTLVVGATLPVYPSGATGFAWSSNLKTVTPQMFGAIPDATFNGSTWVGTDNTAAIQEALDLWLDVYIPPGKYLTTAPLALSPNQHIYCGNQQASYYGFDGAASTGTYIIGQQTGNAILDFTKYGNNGDVVDNCNLIGSPSAVPKSGIYMSRNGTASAGQHTIKNTTVLGNFSQTGIYIVSSEVNKFENVSVDIRGGGAIYGVYASAANDLGFTPNITAGGSTEANFFENLSISNYNTSTTSLIYLAAYNNLFYGWTFRDVNLAGKDGDYVHVEVINGDQSKGPIRFENIVGEIIPGGAGVSYGFVADEYPRGSGYTLSGLEIEVHICQL